MHPWIKSYPSEIKWDENIKPQEVSNLLDKTAARFPNRIAVDFMGKEYDFQTLAEMVNHAAKGFQDLGVKKNVKVGILLPNCPQFIVSYYGILKAGGTVVNYSPLYSESEIKHQVKDSETTMMVTLNLKALYPKIQNLIGSHLEYAIVGELQDALPTLKATLFSLLKGKEQTRIPEKESHIRWNDLLDNDGKYQDIVTSPEQDIAVIQYTGGTTGVPKGALLTHANVSINAKQCAVWLTNDKDGEGITLAALPFFHVFAMTTCMNYGILRGSTLILHPKFELKKVLKDIAKKRPTIMPGVPTMYNAIIQGSSNANKMKSLKSCISGGAPLPVEIKKSFENLTGCVVVEGYGLTESSPVACANPIVGENKAGSIGLPLPNTEIMIEDMEDRGKFLDIGEKGEICIRGPQVMQGYYNKPKDNAEVMIQSSEGVILRTGDVGYVDKDGYIFIVDRLKEMIICGGFKAYPRNIEEVIYQHESVLEVAVIGVSDEHYGQVPKAYIALKPGYELTDIQILEFVKEKLGKHEIPRQIEFRNSLPKTMIGKISKKDL